jgi:hypothetical protein
MASLLMSNRLMKHLSSSDDSTPLLRWQFARGNHSLTCRIDLEPETACYDVSTLPHWDLRRAAIETFEAPTEALQRHAVIAAQLRDAGWTITSYTE